MKCGVHNKRQFSRTCQNCLAAFTDRNNKTKFCSNCSQLLCPSNCTNCGNKIKKPQQNRLKCASCAQKDKHQNGVYQSKGWSRYEFNGVKYRSKWEVDCANLLTELGVSFEYERRSEETNNLPDFYFPSLDRYLEIHPDCHGAKNLPTNCVLAKTPYEAKALTYSVGFRVSPDRTKECIEQMSLRQVRGLEKKMLDMCFYLRAEIEKRRSQS